LTDSLGRDHIDSHTAHAELLETYKKNSLITRDESTRCLIPDTGHGVVGEGQKGENIPTVPSPTTGSARVDLLNLLGL
jgi:hypothetical protein